MSDAQVQAALRDHAQGAMSDAELVAVLRRYCVAWTTAGPVAHFGGGDGSGYGYGFGSGYGSGYGDGDGYGDGSGSGYGDGYGSGSGSGYGSG